MADFQRDAFGDVLLVGGDFVLLTGAAAIQQDIEFQLQVGLGECVYDTTKGTPWIQVLFLDDTTDDARIFILRQIVRNTPGVIECDDLTIDTDSENRIKTIAGSATTIDGDVTFNVNGTAD